MYDAVNLFGNGHIDIVLERQPVNFCCSLDTFDYLANFFQVPG